MEIGSGCSDFNGEPSGSVFFAVCLDFDGKTVYS